MKKETEKNYVRERKKRGRRGNSEETPNRKQETNDKNK